MSDTYNFSEQIYKRTINPSSPFILIGNNVDGFVDVDKIYFKDFEELKSKIETILVNIECRGEWELNLFQISEDCIIKKKYGYFKLPNKGKLILNHSYMDYPIKTINFNECDIEILCGDLEKTENWDNEENDFMSYVINFKRIKIIYK